MERASVGTGSGLPELLSKLCVPPWPYHALSIWRKVFIENLSRTGHATGYQVGRDQAGTKLGPRD